MIFDDVLEPFETTQQVKIRFIRIQLEKVRTDSVLFYLLYCKRFYYTTIYEIF